MLNPKTIDVGTLLDEGRWSPYLKFLVLLAALAIIFLGNAPIFGMVAGLGINLALIVAFALTD